MNPISTISSARSVLLTPHLQPLTCSHLDWFDSWSYFQGGEKDYFEYMVLI